MVKNIPLPTYTETLGEALRVIDIHFAGKGFAPDSDWLDINGPFSTGGIPYETSKSATIEGTIKGRKKFLQVTLYRMPSGRYEVVAYIG